MAHIENLIHNGRTLTGYTDEEGEDVIGWPEVAYEAIRAINHLTLTSEPIPAPVVYKVLGNLKGVGHMLPQALQQLGDGLARSLDEFDVYDRKRDPADSIDVAREHLAVAAAAAAALGSALEDAQTALNAQGYNTGAGDH